MLSHLQARKFYDRFGVRQDWQRFYEGPAIRDLVAHGRFGEASSVFEFGCGTGRLARILLEEDLPDTARYVGVDVSTTMVRLSRNNVAAFGKRAEIQQSDGQMVLDARSSAFDRFVSCYVLDLLTDQDISQLLAEAQRVLVPGGLLCLLSLSPGCTPGSRLLAGLWTRLHALSPMLVGGCRPLALRRCLENGAWAIRHHRRIARFAFPSEIVIAEKCGEPR